MLNTRSKLLAGAVLCVLLAIPSPPAHAAEVPDVADRISAMIGDAMDYPPQALHDSEEGVAEVAFTVDTGFVARNVRILASTGHKELDAAAVRTVSMLRGLPAEAVGRKNHRSDPVQDRRFIRRSLPRQRWCKRRSTVCTIACRTLNCRVHMRADSNNDGLCMALALSVLMIYRSSSAIKPSVIAATTACTRVRTPSLRRMMVKYSSAVRGEMPRMAAMSVELLPSRAQARHWTMRGLKRAFSSLRGSH